MLPIVSFVGPTGVGKSTIMRLFGKEGCPKPLSGNSKSIESTSADIHAYIGSFPTQNNPSTVLLLDCEGSGGTSPSSLVESLKHYTLERITAWLQSRKPYVNTVFPRILYMFSSVYCFVFSGSVKEQQTWVEILLSYASQAAAATVNQSSRPVLVVIFNKTTLDEGEWNIETASAKCQDLRFMNFFSEVNVVCIFACKGAS